MSCRLIAGSSLRMSRLSFRLLLFGVFVDLHLVFLLGILVGNFIFSFLLFSCRGRRGNSISTSLQSMTAQSRDRKHNLGRGAGASEESGAPSGLDVWWSRQTGTEDLRRAADGDRWSQTDRWTDGQMASDKTTCLSLWSHRQTDPLSE